MSGPAIDATAVRSPQPCAYREQAPLRDAARVAALPAPGAAAGVRRPRPRLLPGRLNSPAVRSRLGTVTGVLILAALLWRLGAGVFLDGLRRIDATTLTLATVIGVVTTVCSAWRWRAVARGLGIRLPLGAAVADYYRALFLNAALPGGVLGDVHRAVRHGRDAGDMARCVRAVVLERVAGQIALAVVGAGVLLTLPSPVRDDVRGFAPPVLLAVAGVLAVALAVRMNRPPARRAGMPHTMLGEARRGLLSRGNWPGIALTSGIVLAGHLTLFVVAARAGGPAVPVPVLLPIAVLALLAMGLPLNVGGFGPREGVTAWAFGAAGLGASGGAAVAVVYGVLSFVASLPGAAVLVARWYAGLRGNTAPDHRDTASDHRDSAPVPAAPVPVRVDSSPERAEGDLVLTNVDLVRADGVMVRADGDLVDAVVEPRASVRTAGAAPVRRPAPARRAPLPSAPVGPAPVRGRPAEPRADVRPAQASGADASSRNHASKDSVRLASSTLPFSAEPREGRPMTPDSV